MTNTNKNKINLLKNIKGDLLIDSKAYNLYCKNYKQANEKQKNYTSVSKQLNNLMLNALDKKITNQNVSDFLTVASFLIKDKTQLYFIKSLDYMLIKKSIVKVAEHTQKIGLIKNDDGSKSVDLKMRTGASIIKDALLLIFTNGKKYAIKKAQKEKAKKTLKK